MGATSLRRNTAQEKSVRIFLKEEETFTTNDSEDSKEKDDYFLNDTEFNDRIKRVRSSMPYKPIFHVSPTSNIVERLFSRCGLIMRPHRRLMDPSTLERLVMLRFCRDLWSARELDMLMRRNTSVVASNATSSSSISSSTTTDL